MTIPDWAVAGELPVYAADSEPCPFCGNPEIMLAAVDLDEGFSIDDSDVIGDGYDATPEGRRTYYDEAMGIRWCCQCGTCGCIGPLRDTLPDAIEKWNRREGRQ